MSAGQDDRDRISRTSGVPIYRQVAAALRTAITSGEYRPGDRLPSEHTLVARFGVSRPTARQAIDLLKSEGLVTTEHGRGAFVRTRAQRRRVAATRYRADAAHLPDADDTTGTDGKAPEPGTSFTADVDISWPQYRLDKEFLRVRADPHLAELFDVDEGTELLERRFVFFSDDTPEQISRSYLPLELVGDTPIADPDNEPWPGGNIAQLATVGKRVRRITESVGARMPTPDEVETLRLTSGTPVLVITRRMLTDKDPPEVVEVAADIVLPGDRVTLDYQIDL